MNDIFLSIYSNREAFAFNLVFNSLCNYTQENLFHIIFINLLTNLLIIFLNRNAIAKRRKLRNAVERDIKEFCKKQEKFVGFIDLWYMQLLIFKKIVLWPDAIIELDNRTIVMLPMYKYIYQSKSYMFFSKIDIFV